MEDKQQELNQLEWIDKLTRRQKRIIFKADKYSDRVKKLLMK